MSAIASQFNQLAQTGAAAYAVLLVPAQVEQVRRDDSNKTVGLSQSAFNSIQTWLQLNKLAILQEKFVANGNRDGWSTGSWALGTVGEVASKLSTTYTETTPARSWFDQVLAKKYWILGGVGLLVAYKLLRR